MRLEKRVNYNDDLLPSISASDTKIDNLVKVMERMLEKINLSERLPPREPQNNQNRNRNQNYRRENNQDKKKESDQQIRTPFQQNYVDQYEEDRQLERLEESHVNLVGSDSGDEFFLTEEEQGFFSDDQNKNTYEDSDDYRLGFENAIMEVHKQYNFRSKGSPEISNDKNTSTVVKKTLENQPKKTASNTNTVAKRTDINKDKTISKVLNKVAFKWTCLMPPSQYLTKLEDYIGNTT